MNKRQLRVAAVGVALLSTSFLAACGGGGGSSPTPITAAPTPTASASSSSGRTIHSAPLSSSPSDTQSSTRRFGEASLSTLSNVLIESTGNIASWAGNIVVWVEDGSAGNEISETSGTAVETNGIAINNPSFEPLSCAGSNVTSPTWCAVHPDGWWFGTADVLVKPVGQQTITITFGDGTTGTITDDIYNGFALSCGQSMAYQNGVPTIVTTGGDLTYDCANQQMTFAHGYTLASQPQLDAVGRSSTVIASITAPVTIASRAAVSVPFSQWVYNGVYVFGTGDGGSAKMLPSGTGSAFFSALSLKASADGSFSY